MTVALMEQLEQLRNELDLVEAYWYFVEHSRDGHECSNARKAMARFGSKHLPEVYKLMERILDERGG